MPIKQCEFIGELLVKTCIVAGLFLFEKNKLLSYQSGFRPDK